MSEEEQEVPEGAAYFSQIPPELGVNPLLLGVIHSVVFLYGSSEEAVHPTAADGALDGLFLYLERLEGKQLDQALEDMDCLIRYGREEKWGKQLITLLKSLKKAMGPDEEE